MKTSVLLPAAVVAVAAIVVAIGPAQEPGAQTAGEKSFREQVAPPTELALASGKVDESETWWSLQALKQPVPPDPKNLGKWVRNAIDRFIAATLVEKGLKPSVPADRVTLIRRVTYDLTGLPPTPEEIDA